MKRIAVSPLSRQAFAAYGEVLDASGAPTGQANDGTAEVHRDIAEIDVAAAGGRACLSAVRAFGRQLPIQIEVMENHPLGSQAIAPLGNASMLIVVAPPGPLDPDRIVAFRASRRQGVNYRRGVWHCPLVALDAGGAFLVVDRAGDGENLIRENLAEPLQVYARESTRSLRRAFLAARARSGRA